MSTPLFLLIKLRSVSLTIRMSVHPSKKGLERAVKGMERRGKGWKEVESKGIQDLEYSSTMIFSKVYRNIKKAGS